VATSIELAVLQFNAEAFNSLRRQLTGAATVSLVSKGVDERWGHACVQFMTKLYNHPSKASKGYYYKNHLQYFDSIFRSIQEISRVLRSGGFCALVAQDSHYKEIHNDVPSIMVEMAAHCGMLLLRRDDFISGRSMVTINKKSKNYIPSRQVTESVLCFGR
jgi:hypothetical protein